MGAVLEKQAESPLQEPKATVPVLPVQASGPVHRGAFDPALTMPADMEMIKIAQKTAASSHIRIFMLDSPAPGLSLPKRYVNQNLRLYQLYRVACWKHILSIRCRVK